MAFSNYQPIAVLPANGVQTDFAVPDQFYDLNDVRCVVIIGGVEVNKVRGVDYEVIVISRETLPPYRQTGLVRFNIAPVNLANVVPFILPALVQDQPFQQRPVTPREHERVHDREVQMIAMLYEFFNRGYRSPLDTPAALRFIEAGREGYVPTWDAEGNLVEGPTVLEVSSVAAFINQVVIVAGIQAQVVAVAAINDEITALSAVTADIAALGPAAPGIVALAPLDDEILALAPVATQISQLAPYAVQVGQVAAIRVEVDIVADNIAAVVNASNNMAAIIDAPNWALLAQRFATYAEDTDIPGQGGLRSAYHWAKKAESFASSINPSGLTFSVKAIGEFYEADMGEAGVAIPPSAIVAGNTWVELTAGLTGVGQFNNGKLTGESVTGSAPNVSATANVAVAGPMNGSNIELLNTTRRFMRPGSPGTRQANDNLSHGHTGTAPAHTHGYLRPAANGAQAGTGATVAGQSAQTDSGGGGALTINSSGGTEARPNNIGVRVFRKVG